MIRIMTTLALCVPLALGGCAGVTAPTAATDAQSALTDGQAILAALEATGKLPAQFGSDATLVIGGLQAVLAAYAAAAPIGTAEQQALATAQAAVQQVIADTTDARVKQAGELALTAMTAVAASSTSSTQVQVEVALGAVLLDYLATSPTTVALAIAQR